MTLMPDELSFYSYCKIEHDVFHALSCIMLGYEETSNGIQNWGVKSVQKFDDSGKISTFKYIIWDGIKDSERETFEHFSFHFKTKCKFILRNDD